MTQAELLYSLAAPVTKNTYAGPAVFGPVGATAAVPKIPGGYFMENPNPLGRCLYLQAFGTIANAATGFTFSPALYCNVTPGTASAVLTTIYAATAPTASVTCTWNMQAWMTCTAFGESAGMTLQVNGTWGQTTVASGGVGNAAGQGAQFTGTWTGLTPATIYYPELFGTWSTSSASATTTVQQMFLFGLN